jgi:mono/diheme cytochrome c family protein
MSRLTKICGAFAFALALLANAGQVTAQDTAATAAAPATAGGDVEKGKALFTNNCQQCHNVTEVKRGW